MDMHVRAFENIFDIEYNDIHRTLKFMWITENVFNMQRVGKKVQYVCHF